MFVIDFTLTRRTIMAVESNDKNQLKGMLREFDIGQIQSVLNELKATMMPSANDFSNQGTRCNHGDDGFIDKEHFESNQEAVWGQNNLISAHFLTEGAEIQKAVAMVTLKEGYSGLSSGSGWGSGFLISDTLFMTNNHVIPNSDFCGKVNMQFMYQDNYDSEPAISPEFFETNESSFFHTNASLDYTVVRLARKPYRLRLSRDIGLARSPTPMAWEAISAVNQNVSDGVCKDEQIKVLKELRDVINQEKPLAAFDASRFLQYFGYTPGGKYGHLSLRPTVSYPAGLRLNVIQHPQGRRKEVVIQQNELKDTHTNVIHYYSDTDYGSSGSPVFNNTWDLMALHHARDPSESANEGIRIDKIVADLKSQFQSSNPAILTELNI
jgi:V8-like Glu-specific endopeptidase